MGLYLCIFVILSLLSFIEIIEIGKIEQKYILVILSTVCLFLGTIRYNTGSDWVSYYSYFSQGYTYDYFISNYNFEVGYKLLNYLVKEYAGEYYFLLAIISGICVYCYYKSSINLSKYSITVALVLFSAEFYGIFPVRTTIVTAMALLSYCMIKNKNITRFVFIVIIAIGFHRIAIMLLPTYWFYYKRYSSEKMIFIMLICISVGISGILIDIVGAFSGIDSVYLAKFATYVEATQGGEQFGAVVDKEKLAYYMTAFKFVFIITILRFRRIFESRISNFDGLFNIFFWGACFYFLIVFTSAEIASRLTGIYIVVQYLLMVNMLDLSNKIKYKILIWGILVVTSFMRLYFKFINLPDAFVPFNNIL